jgi:hypothetical protein
LQSDEQENKTEVQNKLTVLQQVQQVAEFRTASYRCYRAPQDEDFQLPSMEKGVDNSVVEITRQSANSPFPIKNGIPGKL